MQCDCPECPVLQGDVISLDAHEFREPTPPYDLRSFAELQNSMGLVVLSEPRWVLESSEAMEWPFQQLPPRYTWGGGYFDATVTTISIIRVTYYRRGSRWADMDENWRVDLQDAVLFIADWQNGGGP